MSKSVLELAVGTGQWDAGLKKAKSALDNFTQSQGGLQSALAKDSDKVQKFVQITVVIINFACIWCVVAVFLQYCKSNTAVDAHGVYWHMAFVSSFLLYYAKDAVTEVLRADAYHIRITLAQVTTQHKHVAYLFESLDLISTHL